MEVCSVLEAISTGSTVCVKLYNFIKAVYNAPEEIRQYLKELEQSRSVLADVLEYVNGLQGSRSLQPHSARLQALSAILEDWNLTFATQLSSLEAHDTSDVTSWFNRQRLKVGYVWGRQAILNSILRLRTSQQLISMMISTSLGYLFKSRRTAIAIEESVSSLTSRVQDFEATVAKDAQLRQNSLEAIAAYESKLQCSISMLMDAAQVAEVQSATRLSDIASSMNEMLGVIKKDALRLESTIPEQNSRSAVCLDSNVESQSNDGTVTISTETDSGEPAQGLPTAEAAFRLFIAKMSPQQAKCLRLVDCSNISSFMSGIPEKSTKKMKRLKRLSYSLKKLVPILDHLNHMHDSTAGILSASLIPISFIDYDRLLDSLGNAYDAIRLCSQELSVNQDEPMFQLAVAAYLHIFEILGACLAVFGPRSTMEVLLDTAVLAPSNAQILDRAQQSLQRVVRKIIHETEFRSRLILRNTASLVANIHLEQGTMFSQFKDQQRMLDSLQQQWNILELARKQQRILRILQQLQHWIQLQEINIFQ
ncbi:hypothetical protein GQ53DRAFT_695565 [Thozetella sp. PMI_491]|nr:hypothetical protein GQ53DRAFT_695565 [Thozetella sp. PMI_491]